MTNVVLPTYNEASTIVSLLTLLDAQMAARREPYEILVVDDDSPDGTAQVIEDHFGSDGPVRVLRRTSARGLARSVLDGLAQTTSGHVVVMDADFNHDPRAVPYLLKYLDDFDLVIGSRFAAGGEMPERARHYGSFAINLFLRIVLRTQVQDNLSGFFAIRRDALARLPADRIFWGYGDYFFRLVYFALRVPLRILEVPVIYRPRRGGESKTPLLRTAGRYLYEIVRLRVTEFRDPAPWTSPRPFYLEAPGSLPGGKRERDQRSVG